jgi:inosine-uridine nucleoside N-ribohydrolase
VRLIHLDTDIGGDTDDLCALAMLLGWPGVELVGVTTCSDPSGLRAGLARYALRLAGRDDVPVVAGADGSLGGYRDPPGLSDLGRYWPEPVAPERSPPGAALDLLARSVEMGATVIGVGPWTNLALLEVTRPGSLASTQLVVMGGYVRAAGAGLPAWEPEMDYNVQQDTLAARIVWERCDPLVVQLSVTLEATLREAHLPRLREGGALARLVARQGQLYGAESEMRRVGREHPRLPDDLLNFHYDPLACAIAAGWDGARVEMLRLSVQSKDGVLTFPESPNGRPTRVVTDVDGSRLEQEWVEAMRRVG